MGTSLYDQYKASQAPQPTQQGTHSLYGQYQASLGQDDPGAKLHAEYASGRLAKRMQRENTNDQEQADAETPSYAAQALGGIASLARDIPGAEAVQAGARALTRGQSYRDALGDIRGAESAAPTGVRMLNRGIGGVVAGAALPGQIAGKAITPAAQGALYGAASGALQSNPDAGIEDRAKAAGVGAAVGGVVGKIGDAATNLVRGKLAPTLGENVLARKAATRAGDEVAYGAANAEAKAAGGTSPALQTALDNPRVKDIVDLVRNSDGFEQADDATVAQEVYKQLSRQRGGLQQRLQTNGYDATLALQDKNLAAGQRALKDAMGAVSTKPAITLDVAPETFETAPQVTPGRAALAGPLGQNRIASPGGGVVGKSNSPAFRIAAEPDHVTPGVSIETPGMRIQTAPPEDVPAVMPSYAKAVQQHAIAEGQTQALQQGADATRRLLGSGSIAGKKLATNSPEAFQASIAKMTPEQAQAALEGVLGRLGEKTSLSFNPIKAFGVPGVASHGAAVSPFIQALEQQAGGASPAMQALRALIASQGHPTP